MQAQMSMTHLEKKSECSRDYLAVNVFDCQIPLNS